MTPNQSNGAFRFKPPPVKLTPEVQWVLARAFADPGWRPRSRIAPQEALRLARALALSGRIAHRCSSSLDQELGQAVAQQLSQDARRAVARYLLHRELVEKVAAAATELRVSVVLLKGMALLASGASDPGCRDAADVDVLVSPSAESRLEGALRRKGFEPSELNDSAHHRAHLHPVLGVLEVHSRLSGVEVEEGQQATADRLLESLSLPVVGLEGLLVPTLEILAAHLLAHAIHQHGQSPAAYPWFRLLADLQDLAPEAEVRRRLLERVARFVRGSVSQREVKAIATLGSQLEAGRWPDLATDSGGLLRHGVAGALDASYRRRLRAVTALKTLARRDWHKIGWRLERAVTRVRRSVVELRRSERSHAD